MGEAPYYSRVKRFFAALLALLAVTFIQLPSASASAKYVVASNTVDLKSSATPKGKRVARLTKGTIVTVTGSHGIWYRISYGGKNVYAQKKYFKKAPVAPHVTALTPSAGIINAKTPLYKSDKTSSAKLMTLAKGAKVMVTGCVGDWYRIKASNGKVGFVEKARISKPTSNAPAGGTTPTPAPSTTPSPSATPDPNATANPDNTSVPLVSLKLGDKGDAVAQLQARLVELGYLDAGGDTYTATTVKAVKYFQLNVGMTITGVASVETQTKLFAADAHKKVPIELMDWFKSDINQMFARGSCAYFIDCLTDTRVNIRRVEGHNHADVEPAFASDTAVFKKLYGGKWSWNTRAVILVIKGHFVAASVNGMPHGNYISSTNNFKGQFCLHTTNSKTHGTDCISTDHQKRVAQAYKYLS